MSTQSSIESFFGKRKRLVIDNGYKSKLLKTDAVNANETELDSTVVNSKFVDGDEFVKLKSIIKDSTPLPTTSKKKQTHNEKPKYQMDIREALKKCQEIPSSPALESPVKFQLLGSLSPAKRNAQGTKFCKNLYNDGVQASTQIKENSEKILVSDTDSSIKNQNLSKNKNDCATEDIIKSAKELASKIKETQKKLINQNAKKNELSLKEIKDKINKSSKLAELKKSINKINQHADELIQMEKKKLSGTQPKLSKFKSIEVSVSRSPIKQQQKSPCKPAYERFAGLVDSPSTTLPLPFGYQKLYEFFCSADTICSMITNRGEKLTFNKLKPAVEEMTRKTFTLRHLGQIATVFPEAFSFHQEKLKNYGSTSKVDKYELVITPLISKNSEFTQSSSEGSVQKEQEENIFRLAEKKAMSPAILKKRKEIFYRNLLEKTKDYHEQFLKTLNPPFAINRSDLKRWHPSFMVDFVPDVNPQELPQPPNSNGPVTARQVLERAKELLSSNVRLQKALEAASEEGGKTVSPYVPEVSSEVRAKVDARLKDPLKGISKSLLEKVRAKQAAKALDAMQMTPEKEKELITFMRLPDMARIIRTTFVNEQKGVLPFDLLIEKVQFSCNRNLGLKEIENHVRLLVRILPEWLSIVTLRNIDFLKINRDVDATSAMTKLNNIVEEKKKAVRRI